MLLKGPRNLRGSELASHSDAPSPITAETWCRVTHVWETKVHRFFSVEVAARRGGWEWRAYHDAESVEWTWMKLSSQHALVHGRVGDEGGRTAAGSDPGPTYSARLAMAIARQLFWASSTETRNCRQVLVSSERMKNTKGKVKRKARV